MTYTCNQLNRRQDLDTPDIDDQDHEGDGPHEKSSMPSLISIRVLKIKHYETLNLSRDQIIETCCGCLPREDGDPA
jgi:hypothetical protein